MTPFERWWETTGLADARAWIEELSDEELHHLFMERGPGDERYQAWVASEASDRMIANLATLRDEVGL